MKRATVFAAAFFLAATSACFAQVYVTPGDGYYAPGYVYFYYAPRIPNWRVNYNVFPPDGETRFGGVSAAGLPPINGRLNELFGGSRRSRSSHRTITSH
jgi:hypothetical protein